jgi:hypothetical protein
MTCRLSRLSVCPQLPYRLASVTVPMMVPEWADAETPMRFQSDACDRYYAYYAGAPESGFSPMRLRLADVKLCTSLPAPEVSGRTLESSKGKGKIE